MRGAPGWRALRLALAVLAVAAAAQLAGACSAVAAPGDAREAAVAEMHARLGPAAGETADRVAVLAAWTAAGARIDATRRHLAETARPGSLVGAALVLAGLCAADLALPQDVPRPGDLLAYREPGGAAAPWRVGMLTGPARAVVLDRRSHRLLEVPRGSLLDERPSAPGAPLAEAGTLRACRVSAALLPSGDPDPAGVGRRGRRIALADAAEMVPQLQWELDHPRDADTGIGHRLSRVAAAPLALVARAAAALLDATGRLAQSLLGALGPMGAPLLGLLRLLGTSFDGRRLNALLTEGALPGPLGPLSLVGSHLPVVGGLLSADRAIASFGIGVLTGIDPSDHDTVGGVVVALLCDLLVLTRPLALAGRLALAADRLRPGAEALHRALDLATRVGDVVSGRPSGLLRLLGRVPPLRRLHDALDAASLILRPASLPGHLAETLGRLAGWTRSIADRELSGSAAERVLAAVLRHLSAEQRAALAGAGAHLTQELAELSHLHSGTKTLVTATAAGHTQPFGADPPPPPIRLPAPSP